MWFSSVSVGLCGGVELWVCVVRWFFKCDCGVVWFLNYGSEFNDWVCFYI